jgi:two-component system response regulator MprA
MCAEIFENNGFTVIVAEDGERALKLVGERQPDVVLTDLFLPHVDGTEIIRKIRATGVQTPIVLMSGSAEGKVRAFQAHASAFLEKPFAAIDALDVVNRLLGRLD